MNHFCLLSTLLLLIISIARCDNELQHQIDVLKDALAIERQERISHIASNEKEINYLSEQVGQITTKLVDLSKGLSDLSEDIGDISGKLDELLTEVGDNTRDLNGLSEKVGNSSGKLNYLSGEVRDNLVKLNSLSTEVGSNSGKLKNLSTKVGYNSGQLDDVSEKVGSISGMVNEMSTEVETNSGQLNGLSSKVGHNSGKLNDLLREVGNNSKGLNDLSTRVANNSGKLNYLTGKVERNSVSLNLLSGNVGNNSYQLYDLYAELNDLSQEVGRNSKKGSIYFSATRAHDLNATSAWNTAVVTLTYDDLLASSPDRSMNVNTGFFTAPISGTFVFLAHAERKPGSWVQLKIRKNGHTVSYAFDQSDKFYGGASATVVLELVNNDIIDVFVSGYLVAYYGNIQFSGFLL